MNKRLYKIIFRLLLSVIIFIAIFKFVNINDVVELFSKISIISILAYLIIYFFVYYMRALRFHYLTEKKISILKWILISFIHGLYNRILPARSGEVSLLYYAKKIGNIEIINSLNILLVSRLSDLISVIILFLAALITSPSALNVYPKVIIISLILILVVLFILIKKLKTILELSISISSWILRKLKLFNKLQKKLSNISTDSIIKFSNKSLLQVFIFSMIQWIFLYFLFFIILKDINNELSLSYVIIGSAYANISNLIPISAVGGFGTMEAGWVLGFTILGVSKIYALSTGFITNIITFIITVILGLAGIAGSKLYKKRRSY